MSDQVDEKPKPPVLKDLLLTVPEVAELLRTTDKGIYGMVARKTIPGVRRAGTRVLFYRPTIEAWLAKEPRTGRGSVPAGKEAPSPNER